MKSYTIYFFRHGMTKGNINAQYIGHTDYPLSSKGIEELHKIKGSAHYPDVDAVFSSPLKRSVDSAKIMFPKNEIIEMRELIEYNFGEFEECTAKDLENNENFKEWLKGDMQCRPPFGESNAEFIHRVCDGFEKIMDAVIKTQTKTSAIVCHAGVLTTILSCFGLPEAPMAHWQMDSGYGYKLRLTPSLWMQSNKLEVIDTSPISVKDIEKT